MKLTALSSLSPPTFPAIFHLNNRDVSKHLPQNKEFFEISKCQPVANKHVTSCPDFEPLSNETATSKRQCATYKNYSSIVTSQKYDDSKRLTDLYFYI